MAWEIWQIADNGMAALVKALGEEEREMFERYGCRRLKTLETEDQKEADDRFVAWCRQKVPDARVVASNRPALDAELERLFGVDILPALKGGDSKYRGT